MLRSTFFVWTKTDLSKNEFVKMTSIKNVSLFLFFDTLIWRISVDWILAETKNCFVEILKRKRSMINEKLKAIDKRTCDFFESLNLSFLKTFENMKNELNFRKITKNDENSTRSMIEKTNSWSIVLNDLLLILFDVILLLLIKLNWTTNKKLK